MTICFRSKIGKHEIWIQICVDNIANPVKYF